MTMTRRSVLVAGAALATVAPATAWAAPAASPATLSLTPPTGPYRVGIDVLHLVDPGRPDPLSPDGRPRELMVRLLYPTAARRTPDFAYLSPALSGILIEQFNAQAGSTLPPDLLTFPTHGQLGAPVVAGRHPLVLFSPGLGFNAALYTAIVEDLASHGYIVAAIDHTFDAVVEFPDGRIEPPAAGVPSGLMLRVRVDDMRFVLDRVGCRPGIAGVAAVGHSMGSMTSAHAIAADGRIRAGVALDGDMVGSPALDRPFLLAGNPRHRRATDPVWAGFYDRLRGPRLHFVIDGVLHNDFSDLTLFKSTFDLTSVFALGTIDGQRATAILRAYALAWLDRHLRGRTSPLLIREPDRFPEVDFQP